jgi:surfeit locus 1 family protein
MSETRNRFPWGLTLAVVPALALLLTLGVWQVQRLHWKEGLIAEAEAAAARPPVPLHAPRPTLEAEPAPAMPREMPPPYSAPRFPEFQKVVVSCIWWNHAFVELRAIHDGVAGVRVISLCDGFLVDRGFIPEGVVARPEFIQPIVPPVGPGTPIIAQARTVPAPSMLAPSPSGRTFYARDIKAMTAMLGGDPDRVAPQVLFAEQSTAPELPELIAVPPPAAFSNNHLGYALTWFGLALALVGTYVALLRRRTGAPVSEESST